MLKLILKAWVRFDNEGDIECICNELQCSDCKNNYDCNPYIVKFTPIEEKGIGEDNGLNKSTKNLNNNVRKLSREVEKINRINRKFIK